jgi:gluconolactonase
MSTRWRFEKVAGPFTGEANGVMWRDGAVWFALRDDSQLLRYDPKTGETAQARRYTNRVNGIAQGPKEQLYGAQEGGRRIVEFHADGRMTQVHAKLDGRWHNQPCDLTVDRQGRIWFCDPHSDVLPFGPRFFPPLEHASVLRIARNDRSDWVLARLTYDTVCPRALVLDAQERTLFLADGLPKPEHVRELRAYGIGEDGRLGPPRVLLTFGSDHRGPHRGVEGLCRGADGNIIACGGWRKSGAGPAVYVFSPQGELLAAQAFAGDAPNRCCVGEGGEVLYVTTVAGELFRGEPA